MRIIRAHVGSLIVASIVFIASSHAASATSLPTSTGVIDLTASFGSFTNAGAIAAHPGMGLVYVSNHNPLGTVGGLSVIDTATDTVARVVPISPHTYGLAVDAAGNRIFTGTTAARAVQVISTTSWTVTDTIDVAGYPESIAFDPVRSRLFVSMSTDLYNEILVLDTTTMLEVARLTISGGSSVRNVAIDQASGKAYVANAHGYITVVDGTTMTKITNPGGYGLYGITIDQTTRRAYSGTNNGHMLVVDTATDSVVADVTLSANPTVAQPAVFPTTGHVFMPDRDLAVFVIDRATNTSLGSISVGRFPRGVAVDETSGKAYVANGAASVHVFRDAPPSNRAPVPDVVGATTEEDVPVPVTLSATDPDGDALTYGVVTSPARGTLSGIAPNLTYTPASNTNGNDSFSFSVGDGTVTVQATATLTINPVNDAPVAQPQTLPVDEDTAVPVTLTATDVDGDALTYSVETAPGHGSLSGVAPALTYRPATGYTGADSFTFSASDGAARSEPATVSITVSPVNDAPVCDALSLTLPEEHGITAGLTCRDAEGDPLSVAIATQPAHGTAGTIDVMNVTYQPVRNYFGPDAFTVTVSDGFNDTTVPVSVTVTNVNDVPVVVSSSHAGAEDTPLAIVLQARDVDGDVLRYTLSAPANGTLSGVAPNLTYRPRLNWSGADSFMFRVSDGVATSTTAIVAISIAPVNDAPVVGAITPSSTLLVEGDTGSIRADLSDADLQSWRDLLATIEWGDGTSSAMRIVGTRTPGVYVADAFHLYTRFGRYNVTITVSDGRGGTAKRSRAIDVRDAPLFATGPDGRGSAGVPWDPRLVGCVTDVNPFGVAKDLSAVVHWGDGTRSTATVVAEADLTDDTGRCTGGADFGVLAPAHTYKTAGIYTVRVVISSRGGSTATGLGTARIS